MCIQHNFSIEKWSKCIGAFSVGSSCACCSLLLLTLTTFDLKCFRFVQLQNVECIIGIPKPRWRANNDLFEITAEWNVNKIFFTRSVHTFQSICTSWSWMLLNEFYASTLCLETETRRKRNCISIQQQHLVWLHISFNEVCHTSNTKVTLLLLLLCWHRTRIYWSDDKDDNDKWFKWNGSYGIFARVRENKKRNRCRFHVFFAM